MSEVLSKEPAIELCESIDLNTEFFDEDNEEYTMLRDDNYRLWVAYQELFTLAYIDEEVKSNG